MYKFKAGDRVRCKESGFEGTIFYGLGNGIYRVIYDIKEFRGGIIYDFEENLILIKENTITGKPLSKNLVL